MPIRAEVIPFILGAAVFGAAVGFGCLLRGVRRRRATAWGLILALVCSGYFLYFFRDPERTPPAGSGSIVAAADGRVAAVTELDEDAFALAAERAGIRLADLPEFKNGPSIRISIFLSLFDVHVNRAPMSGESRFLGYFPGRHYFTFQEKSSDHNQHNSILMRNEATACLINQIVGPVCRRVVYWPDHDRPVTLKIGDRIGMMKFGSRLDMYLPAADVEIGCRPGDRVRAGETVVARLRGAEEI